MNIKDDARPFNSMSGSLGLVRSGDPPPAPHLISQLISPRRPPVWSGGAAYFARTIGTRAVGTASTPKNSGLRRR